MLKMYILNSEKKLFAFWFVSKTDESTSKYFTVFLFGLGSILLFPFFSGMFKHVLDGFTKNNIQKYSVNYFLEYVRNAE